MKAPILLIFCLLVVKTDAQNRFIGHYHDFFASSVVINYDSTFKYKFRFDTESSWTKGIWTTNKDTIYFQVIPIFDTLKYTTANGIPRDSLRLSLDDNGGQVTIEETQILYSGGQERHPCPRKLYFKRNKLYYITPDGKLLTKKFSWGNKKLTPWFVRARKA